MGFRWDGENDAMFAGRRGAQAVVLRFQESTQRQECSDAVEATEAALATLGAVRAWLESGELLMAIEQVSPARLEGWLEQLASGQSALDAWRDVVLAEMALSLRERNRRRPDLLPSRPTRRADPA